MVGLEAVLRGRSVGEGMDMEKQKKTEMLQGAPAEAARKLVEQLKNQARAI